MRACQRNQVTRLVVIQAADHHVEQRGAYPVPLEVLQRLSLRLHDVRAVNEP